MIKHGILHAHSEYSLHDSTQTPDEMVCRAKELGCRNITLTDHGTLLGVIPFMDAGKKYEVNTIPGVEAYLEGRKHLIIVAKDYEGFLSISHAMRDANEHQEIIRKKLIFPIMTNDILEKHFKGNTHVFATSACIQGPIGSILLENYYKLKKQEKERTKAKPLEEYVDLWEDANQNYLSAKEKENSLKKEKTVINKFVKQPFLNQINKKAEKLKKLETSEETDTDKYHELKRELTKMKNSRGSAMEQVKCLETSLSQLTEERKKWKATADKYKSKKERYEKLMKALKEVELISEGSLYERAKKEALYLKAIFPSFAIELQNHGLEQEAYVMPLLVKLAHETNVPIVAANDAHMKDGNDKSISARQLVRFNYFEKHQEVSDADKTMYLKTDEELIEALSHVASQNDARIAVENTRILENCHIVFPKEKHYPKVKSRLSFDELLSQARSKKIKAGEWGNVYEERLKYEIEIIKTMGYVDYHMVVRDFCNEIRILGCIPRKELSNLPLNFDKAEEWIKRKNFRSGVGVGPGRGSAAGSLVCYLLGITNIDPVKYDLLFERFLNPQRVSMPDIDTDVKTSLRPTIIRYFKWKYGEHAVCSITTETTYAAKGSVQMAGRDRQSELFDHLPIAERNAKRKEYLTKTLRISDMIPEEPDITLSDMEDEFLKTFEADKEAMLIWNHAKSIEGRLSGTGVHAGGVVISDNDDINDYIPLAWKEDKQVWAAQCDMFQVEEHGMLKMDVLGLLTLDCISDCLQLVEKNYGIVIDMDKISFDPEVFENIYSKGLTNSVFQFESSGMKNMLTEFKPTGYEDLILLVAAYRPGPMQYLGDIIETKRGRKPITYKTPALEAILSKTYGAVIYQEQVMQIFQKLAGYSLGDADLVRRAMSKKKEEKLKKERQAFVYGDNTRNIAGCVSNDIEEAVANALFDEMMDFAKYAFNKSHAAAYALVSYQTAWLKYHYPAEYLCAMFNNKEQDQFSPILEDCNTWNIQLLPPSINKSYYEFTIEDSSIRYGFKGIKGIKDEKFVDRLTTQRSTYQTENLYISLIDFLKRNTDIEEEKITIPNKRTMEAFINSGCFDELDKRREGLLLKYQKCSDIAKKNVDKKLLFSLFDELNCVAEDILPNSTYNRKMEIELLGSIVSENPLSTYKADSKYMCTPLNALVDGNVNVFGLVVNIEKGKTKSGKNKIELQLQGKTGIHSVLFMNRSFDRYEAKLEKSFANEVVRINCSCKDNSLFANSIQKLSPSVDSFSFLCDTEEKLNTLFSLLENDNGLEELHIQCFFARNKKSGEIHRINYPLCTTKNVSMTLIKQIGAVKEKNIGIIKQAD